MKQTFEQLKNNKTSNRIYILGSGPSVLDVTKEQWDEVNKHDSIGFNHWYVHDFEPTFYDLSYYTDSSYFKNKEEDMINLATTKFKNSTFIFNPNPNKKTNNVNYYETLINHFDLFEYQNKDIKNSNPNELGKLAKYWNDDMFTHFNIEKGNMMPNKNYIYKSRGQLFATFQLAILLGYTDIRFIGIDLTSEDKFQDHIKEAPYTSKSVGHGGEKMQARVNAENGKIDNNTHSTAQATKDGDYVGVHKLISIFYDKYLKNKGIKLTTSNPNSLLTTTGIEFLPIELNIETLMPQISFCIPSKSNLRYLKQCIRTIRNNAYRNDHDILVWIDEDKDGTLEWLSSQKDENLKFYINNTGALYGIAKAYDELIKKATTDIVMIFHADMMLGENADFELWRYLQHGNICCSTRIEPPLHPAGKEKIVEDYGMWPELTGEDPFKETEFQTAVKKYKDKYQNKSTNGMFAPWMVYKSDFNKVGGHDWRFKSAREDSDLFNRFKLEGYNLIQSWSSLVYHLTCRAGQFQHAKSTNDLKTKSNIWAELMNYSSREFIRKWGSGVKTDEYLHPVITPKYNIGLVAYNCTKELLPHLEILADTLYVDDDKTKLINHYCNTEQIHTTECLFDKVKTVYDLKMDGANNDIVIIFNCNSLTNQYYQTLLNIRETIYNQEAEFIDIEETAKDIFYIQIMDKTLNKTKYKETN